MKSLLSFLSLLALGLILASVYSLVERGLLSQGLIDGGLGTHLDYRSVTLGLVIGFILSNLTRVSWNEVPKRALSWIWIKKEGGAFEIIFIVVLLVIIFFF